ncbi:MAG: formylglycine-generating enzyme family protein [Paludibacteraceae bacterium]|nr:formylglycine-generating enzyme family protein [Paludibacteraceae bacterium]
MRKCILALLLMASACVMGQAQTSAIKDTVIELKGVSFKMVAVEGGTFKMGAQRSDAEGNNYDSDAMENEAPLHRVTLSDYYIGQTEVTQALYRVVMGDVPDNKFIESYGLGDAYPAYNISWDDVMTFIERLDSLTGKKFRLPTEAEWEYAARGGKNSKQFKYAGSNNIDSVAIFYDNYGKKKYSNSVVMSKGANELGIYDMSGSVYEWCGDWFGSYTSEHVKDPKGAVTNSFRIVRGGAWRYKSQMCRVSARDYYNPTKRSQPFIGFRIVMEK